MEPIILVHGGAGWIPDSRINAKIKGVKQAASIGYKVLKDGGSVVDAVEKAVQSMELDDAFNAGYGSVLNLDGEVEMDASIMVGANLSAGAVTVVRDIQHPISLARMVMERTPHVLLAGQGANRFAREQGVPQLEPGALVSPYALMALADYKKNKGIAQTEIGTLGSSGTSGSSETIGCPGTLRSSGATGSFGTVGSPESLGSLGVLGTPGTLGSTGTIEAPSTLGSSGTTESLGNLGSPGDVGTVGAVAIDSQGRLAAATSTGGINGKMVGRSSDTSLIGSGTYADDFAGAVSTTGHGETIAKYCLAHAIVNGLKNGKNPQSATDDALKEMTERLKNTAGAITISKTGEVGIGFTSRRMSWAYQKGQKMHYGIEPSEHNSEDIS